MRRARDADAAAVAALVNRAYAVEAGFLHGERTSADEIRALVRRGALVVLERASERPTPTAAVYVEATAAGGALGLLSVAPEAQGLGLGTRLVRVAEALCEAAGAHTVRLRVINLRDELGRWYRSLGYVAVGTSPCDPRRMKRPCHFIEMQRTIAGAGRGAAAGLAS